MKFETGGIRWNVVENPRRTMPNWLVLNNIFLNTDTYETMQFLHNPIWFDVAQRWKFWDLKKLQAQT